MSATWQSEPLAILLTIYIVEQCSRHMDTKHTKYKLCVGIHYLLSGKTQRGIPLLHSYDKSVKNLHLRLPRCAYYLNTLNEDRW